MKTQQTPIEPLPASDLFGRVSRRAAIQAIFTGAAVLAAVPVPSAPSGQRYFIAIDPASDVPDHYVEGIFRVDEHGTTVVSMRRFANADALSPNTKATDRPQPKDETQENKS